MNAVLKLLAPWIEEAVDDAAPVLEETVVEEEEKKEVEIPEIKPSKKHLDDFADNIIVLDENTVNNYTIDDILIPLYGNEIKFPSNNVISDVIHALLREDGVTPEDFVNSKQEFFIRGGFRTLISKPKDLKWDIVHFDDKDGDLLSPNYNKEEDPPGVPGGKYKAIRMKFSLKKSVYATMCIRELTKTSTSFEVQSKLSENVA